MSPRVLSTLIAVAVALPVGLAAAGCSSGPQGPAQAAEAFVSDFAGHRVQAAADRTSQPEKAGAALTSAWDRLQAEKLVATTGDARVTDDTAVVDYTYEWHLPKDRVWTYRGQLPMTRTDGRWQVRWSAADIHPQLGNTQTLQLRSTPAPRARVNERSGSDVLVPGTQYRVLFQPSMSKDPRGVAATLANTLRRFDEHLAPDSLLSAARKAQGPYPVVTLTEWEFGQVNSDILGLSGVTFTKEYDLVPTDRRFAPDLMTQVRKTVIDEVDGKAGWSVVTVNANGVDTDVLTEVAPQTAPSFSLSVDRNVQDAAQQAVDARTEQAMMVVLQPSTGAILAIAQNEEADKDGPVAATGLYPPGSTFKTVTAAAAMTAGHTTPDTSVPCPSQITVGERTIPNYNLFSVGTVSMATAYERSCNTSFAKIASELGGEDLRTAAQSLGLGPDYTVAGLPTVSGSVPVDDDEVQRAEDGIGQGKVLASPFGMALVAATVAHGATPVPYLIANHATQVSGSRAPVRPEVIDGLRLMMRKVVLGGTAERIVDQGEVYGKTGEAEVDGGSHAWFIGYRGDLAWATLVVRGGSSDNAVAVTRDMLTALPQGY
ncbi:penicillin-binding transpeptidase domain-containing protein [Nocardia yunnanensis]|uniref:Penicillin-binding transpeptidase domain-containing protein n=1 Tax=Nocardia yunnanensis TaxID=2382165 RepID=A0A386ZJS6_9NOCA|nr:penicillin-binding transpeptidase domain-containing protein [Nocardia yunnanensis]AYF77620.1 penicillin-binding transpeptidase domain-containing protein [Nocardia yunnanensis]